MKFTLRAARRTRKRKIRGILEVLETRKLMAGDLNMGSYVIAGGEPDIEAPSAIESVEKTTPIETPAASAAPDMGEPAGVDAALTGDQSWLPPEFLPCCPAVKFDDAAAEATLNDSDGSEGNVPHPVNSVTTFQTNGNPNGSSGPRSPIVSSLRTVGEHHGTLSLSSMGSPSDQLLGVSDSGDAASDEFRYFAAEGNRNISGGPSLAKQSLLGHSQSDTFMAMSLLPSPQWSEPQDESISTRESATQSYHEHSVRSDDPSDGMDLNSLREAASAAESAQIVAPLPFLVATTDSLSAAVASVVRIDFWADGAETHTDDAGLIAKLNENRFQFAAFAFVFTVVTVRMNSRESEDDETEMQTQEESSRVPS